MTLILKIFVLYLITIAIMKIMGKSTIIQMTPYDYAILEPIGEVSIIPRAEDTPVTVQHLEIPIKDEGLPIAVIIDGRIQSRNLQLLGKSKEWLMGYLTENELYVKDILYAYVNEKTEKLNIHKRNGT